MLPRNLRRAPNHVSSSITVSPLLTELAEGARLMRRERVGAIPIVDAGRLVGILTRSDAFGATSPE